MYFATFTEVLHQQHKDSPSRTVCKEPILLILKSSLQMKTKHGFHLKSVQAVRKLRSWSHGKDTHLPFGIPAIWREQTDHVADCYFCMVIVKGFNKKNKHSTPTSRVQLSFEACSSCCGCTQACVQLPLLS